jgi:hypothetical protein
MVVFSELPQKLVIIQWMDSCIPKEEEEEEIPLSLKALIKLL